MTVLNRQCFEPVNVILGPVVQKFVHRAPWAGLLPLSTGELQAGVQTPLQGAPGVHIVTILRWGRFRRGSKIMNALSSITSAIVLILIDAGALTGRGGMLPSIHNHIRFIIILIIFITITITIISNAVPAAVALTVRGEAARISPPTQDPPAEGGEDDHGGYHRGDGDDGDDDDRGDDDDHGGADEDDNVGNNDYRSTHLQPLQMIEGERQD